MPKKTKKSKIRADQKRSVHQHREHTEERQVTPSSSDSPFTFSLQSNVLHIEKDRTVAVKPSSLHDYAYVFLDIKKILFFTLLAIGFQLVLVFLLRTK